MYCIINEDVETAWKLPEVISHLSVVEWPELKFKQ